MRFLRFGPRIAGIRTGLSLAAEDFASAKPTQKITNNDSFLYVIKGDHGLCKIGITANPDQRLAQLQYAAKTPLSFAWIGAAKDRTVAIEREAHGMLAQYRRQGEWFEVSSDAAVGAISAAAHQLGQPVVGFESPERAELARQLALQPPRTSTAIGRAAGAVFQLLISIVVVAALAAFLFVRLGRLI
jgi:predicted GIY-YIG superfamily endonuclease